MSLRIDVIRISPARGEPLPLPSHATGGAAGLDLRADAAVSLAPGERALVPTGLVVAIPPGFEGQVRPRSGLALREGVTCLDSPGTIHSGYPGRGAIRSRCSWTRSATTARWSGSASVLWSRTSSALPPA